MHTDGSLDFQYTFVMIKPDGVAKRVVGEIIKRIEEAGLGISALCMGFATRELIEEHYAVHRGKEFYENIVCSIAGQPVVAIAVVGYDAVRKMRELIGPTDPQKAPTGTIRGDFGDVLPRNVIHASDSPLAGAEELLLWHDRFITHSGLSRELLLEECAVRET